MKITYDKLRTLIKSFGKDDNSIQTFVDPDIGGEAQLIYQQANEWNTLLYIKYVFYPSKDINTIIEPMIVDFSGVDFNNLDDDFDKVINILEHYCSVCGVVPETQISITGTNNDDMIRRINGIRETYKQTYDFTYGFAVDLTHLNDAELTTEVIYGEIVKRATSICELFDKTEKVKENSKPLQVTDFTYVYITQSIPVEVALELQFKLKDELNFELKYHSAEFFDAIEEQQRRERLEETKAIAEKCYGLYFDDSLLRDYHNFADDYNVYEEVYKVICDWLEAQDTQGRCRYIVGEETCRIPCIAILLAWVTVTTGTVFIFKAELERIYTEMMNLFLKGSILPANLKFRMLTKQPMIRDRILLGVSTTYYGHINIDTLVALKRVNHPVRVFRGVPLGIILSEILCTNDEGVNVDVSNPIYKGFFMGRPKFTNSDVIVVKDSLSPADIPMDTIDVVVRSFEERRQEVYNNLGTATDAIKSLYSPSGYDKLLPQYLYAFEMIFTHYMGYDKFYTLNDIYIFQMQTENGPQLYACNLEFDSVNVVHPISFCDGKPIIDEEELFVDNIYSPMFVADFQSTVEENGYRYPEVNPEIQAAFEEALRVIKPVVNEEYLQIETESTTKATADIYDYLYPVISTNMQTAASTVVEFDGSLQEDLKIFFKELIYSERKRIANSNLKARSMQSESTDLSVITDNTANINLLKEKIVSGLCDRVALKNRTQDLPKLFNQEYFSYKGLRYLHPVESPVDWTGSIKNITKLSPAMCKKRR